MSDQLVRGRQNGSTHCADGGQGAARVHLLLAVALIASLAVALTVVSIGVARADTLHVIKSQAGRLTLVSVIFGVAGLYALTAAVMRLTAAPQRRRDAATRW